MAQMTIAVGAVEAGDRWIDGRHYIRIRMTATEGGDAVDLTFGAEHFVTVVDHLKMVADEMVGNRAQRPGNPQ